MVLGNASESPGRVSGGVERVDADTALLGRPRTYRR